MNKALSTLRCAAGEGLGNRFLLAYEGEVFRCGVEEAEAARRLCAAEGVDGLLVLGAGRGGGPPRLRVRNRDGSEGGACLNGMRVAALASAAPAGEFEMAGHRVGWRLLDEDGLVELHLRAADLPHELALRAVDLGGGHRGLAVPFWNPHCVVPVTGLPELDLEELAAAAAAERDLFPDGVNVEAIAEGGEGTLLMRVHERGVGETAACGSGAVAVALVAWTGGGARPLAVVMRGGMLHLEPDGEGGLLLTGPASCEAPRALPL